MRYSETVHQEAYQLFLQGYARRQISEYCHVPLPTIYLWQRRWREKLSGQTLKDLPLEDAGTLLLTTQALRRELEEAQRDLQILHESGILRTIPIRDRSLFAHKYADQVPYIYKVFELSSSAFFRYRKESAAPSERAKQQALYRKEVQRIFFGKRRAVRCGADPPEAAAKRHPPGQKAHPADDGCHGTDQL